MTRARNDPPSPEGTAQSFSDVRVEGTGPRTAFVIPVNPIAKSAMSTATAMKAMGTPIPNEMFTETNPNTTPNGAVKARTVKSSPVVPIRPLSW